MNVILAGPGGLLGRAFASTLSGIPLVTWSTQDLSTEQADQFSVRLREAKADVLINCSADTDVEGAEENPERSFEVNGRLPQLLAHACAAAGTAMVHFSSTGCYGDWKTEPYIETDTQQPATIHHRSKVAGEAAVRATLSDHLIFRVGWLFGDSRSGSRNFVKRRLEEAAGKDVLFSDPTQRGNPTFAGDVAKQVLHVLKAGERGTFNCVSGGGPVSRLSYVSAIVEDAGLRCCVQPATTFVRRAPVSPNESAINERLNAIGLNIMPDWREPLARYVQKLIA